VIDALPGLYGPKAFLRNLEQAESAFRGVKSLTSQPRDEFLRNYHVSVAKSLATRWQNDL
jgi:hypothetical protein